MIALEHLLIPFGFDILKPTKLVRHKETGVDVMAMIRDVSLISTSPSRENQFSPIANRSCPFLESKELTLYFTVYTMFEGYTDLRSSSFQLNSHIRNQP